MKTIFKILFLLQCLYPSFSFAQLEFSNWVVGENTILHINLDGTTSLETYDNIYMVFIIKHISIKFYLIIMATLL